LKPTRWVGLAVSAIIFYQTIHPQISWAQTAAPAAESESNSLATIDEAKRRYSQGIRFYEDGDYRLAANEFERAYKLSKSYKILYNIGQVHLQLNNYARAVDSLERYLSEGGKEVPDTRRREVERDIKNYQARTARVTVEANVAGAEVTVDDSPMGVTPLGRSLRLDVGTHRISIAKENLIPASKIVSLAASEEVKISVELKEESRPSVVVVNSGATAPAKKSYVWIAWAATGTLAAGTLVSGLIANQQLSDLRDLRDNNNAATRKRLNDTESRANTTAIVTDILGGATLAAVGVSLYLTLRKPTPESKPTPAAPGPSLALQGGLSHLGLRGTF